MSISLCNFYVNRDFFFILACRVSTNFGGIEVFFLCCLWSFGVKIFNVVVCVVENVFEGSFNVRRYLSVYIHTRILIYLYKCMMYHGLWFFFYFYFFLSWLLLKVMGARNPSFLIIVLHDPPESLQLCKATPFFPSSPMFFYSPHWCPSVAWCSFGCNCWVIVWLVHESGRLLIGKDVTNFLWRSSHP